MSIETIIAETITDGTAALEDALTIAGRVKAALQAANLLVEAAPAYEPQPYPKWVGTRIVNTEEQEKALTAPEPEIAGEFKTKSTVENTGEVRPTDRLMSPTAEPPPPVAWEEPVPAVAETKPVTLEPRPVAAESGNSAALEPATPPHEAPATA